MKRILSLLFMVLIYVSAVTMVLSTVTSVGYGLYLWGAVGTLFSVACWSAFSLWLKLFFGGVLTIVLSFIGLTVVDK